MSDKKNTSETITPPSWLTDSEALAFWFEHGPGLQEAGRLEAKHAATFAALCAAFGSWRAAKVLVDTEGMILTGAGGVRYANPAVALSLRLEKAYLALSREFGLSPLADGRLPKVDKTPKGVAARDRALELKFFGQH